MSDAELEKFIREKIRQLGVDGLYDNPKLTLVAELIYGTLERALEAALNYDVVDDIIAKSVRYDGNQCRSRTPGRIQQSSKRLWFVARSFKGCKIKVRTNARNRKGRMDVSQLQNARVVRRTDRER